MVIKKGVTGLITTMLGCSMAFAGAMGSINSPQARIHPMVSLQGGYASLKVGNNSQRFTGSDTDIFTYTNSNHKNNKGFIGAFLGVEYPASWIKYPALLLQSGVEYNYFGRTRINGINTVGIEPGTATIYDYNYNFRTQQILGLIKVLATHYERFYPYGEVGLGAAFNRNSHYTAVTTETGSINITPTFNNRNTTQFSYSLGVGMDAQVNSNIRVGLGYRYSNFGSSSLGNGVVTFNNYQAPAPFSVSGSHAYTNQLLGRISYLA